MKGQPSSAAPQASSSETALEGEALEGEAVSTGGDRDLWLDHTSSTVGRPSGAHCPKVCERNLG